MIDGGTRRTAMWPLVATARTSQPLQPATPIGVHPWPAAPEYTLDEAAAFGRVKCFSVWIENAPNR